MGLRSAIGSSAVRRFNRSIARWALTFTLTKLGEMTKLIASWNLKTMRWALSRTAGDGGEAWTTGSRYTARRASRTQIFTWATPSPRTARMVMATRWRKRRAQKGGA